MFFTANEEQPIAQDWTWLDALSGPIDEDVVRAVDEKPAELDRPELDQLVDLSPRMPYMLTAWEDRRRRPPFCLAELSLSHDPVVPMRRHKSPLWRLGRVSLL